MPKHVLLWVGLLFVATASAADWKAGVGRLNITPTQGLWMSGYGSREKPAEGTLTELWAKCLALEDAKGQRVVLITLDLVGIDRVLSRSVVAGITKAFGVDREGVLLSCSHTHSGPVVGNNLRAMYFLSREQEVLIEAYTAQLQTNLVALAGQALQKLEPVKVSWGTGHAGFAVNRRNNRETEIEALRASGRLKGPRDHDVPVLAIHSEDGKLKAVVSGYACHATVLSSMEWSGDWPGFAQLTLEQRHPGALALFWAGCGADQNPLPRRKVELARQYGGELADAVEAVLTQRLVAVRGTLQRSYREIPLPFASVPSLSELQRTVQATNRYETNRAGLLLKQMKRDGALPAEYPYPIQTWQLGEGPVWVALGGEVVVDYALRLKNEFGRHLWVMGYANDVMAYIPSERILTEGGYEGGGAMVYYGQPGPWASGVEERIFTEARRQLRELNLNSADPTNVYPDHRDLTVYLDQAGSPQMITNRQGWARRRTQVLEGFQLAAGAFPDLRTFPPLDVQRRKMESTDAYDRLEISYQVEPGRRVPAYLLKPVGRAGRKPAMLCLHQTVDIGKAEPAGFGNRPNLRYADELARRGYVCLVPDYPSFGDLKNFDFKAAPYPSGTMQGIVNHVRGVDVLVADPDVDPERIGVIGHSLGGHNAIFVGLFDPRLKVVVTSCGWTPFHDYYQGKIAGWTSDRYMPRLRTRFELDPNRVPFDFHELIAALAPRAFFSNSPLRDDNFSVTGVRQAVAAALQVYSLHAAEDQLQVRYPDSTHDFPPDIRAEAYAFIDQVLKGTR